MERPEAVIYAQNNIISQKYREFQYRKYKLLLRPLPCNTQLRLYKQIKKRAWRISESLMLISHNKVKGNRWRPGIFFVYHLY